MATVVLRNWFIPLLDDQDGTASHELRQSSVLTITLEWRQAVVLPPKVHSRRAHRCLEGQSRPPQERANRKFVPKEGSGCRSMTGDGAQGGVRIQLFKCWL